MTQQVPELYAQLNQGPAVLFLGQGYLKLDTGQDVFLRDIVEKFGPAGAEPTNYDVLLESTVSHNQEASLAWLQRRNSLMSVPPWLEMVAGFAWSSLYTSSIDNLWARAFRTDWREIYRIYESKYVPSEPRSRSRLNCTMLFGSIVRSADEISERPPLSSRELRNRRQEAIVLARRLPEIITPFGVLVVEGYQVDDWFDLETSFLPIVDELRQGQVHMFSVDEVLANHRDIRIYASEGRIVLHNESLASYLLDAQEQAQLQLGLRPFEGALEQQLNIGGRLLQIPPDVWNSTSRSAAILSSSLLSEPAPLSRDREYHEFRNFLRDAGLRPMWSGYSRGFAFLREYEKELGSAVDRALASKSLGQQPIIVHGQSGTGKSVALGALAFGIHKRGTNAVLFIEDKPQKPVPDDIDAFCKWAEDNGVESTLIVWDGMSDVHDYSRLLHYLVSRGRKVVLVGSTYSLKDQPNNHFFVKASPLLDPEEVEAFTTFVARLDPDVGRFIGRKTGVVDSNFLVALYRLLPPTRSGIRSSLEKEVVFAESQISQKAQRNEAHPINSLAMLLREAGWISDEDMQLSEVSQVGEESLNEIQQIIGLVMVPGRFGLKVPLELIIRAIRKTWMDDLVRILSEVDIFRWYEDTNGNLLIGPRHSLEAQLIVQQRLGTPTTEVAFARRLIVEIKGGPAYNEAEVQFAVDLVRAMGPNGQHAYYFAPVFLELAEALRESRETKGVANPRLVLQEATLLREWAKRDGIPASEASNKFIEAEHILQNTLKQLREENPRSRLIGPLQVELGTNLASRTYLSLQSGSSKESEYHFETSQQQLYEAIARTPDDFHPYHVIFWSSKEMLTSDMIDEAKKAEIVADLLNAFSIADPDAFDPIQTKLYFESRYKLGELLAQPDLSESAFERLISLGSRAGYYLKASSIAGQIPTDRVLQKQEVQRARRAAEYLQANRSAISEDGRCLNLLLNLWWTGRTLRPILYGERQTLPFDLNDWRYVVDLISEIQATSYLHNENLLNLLMAIARFHIGELSTAIGIFRDLERESENVGGRKRVIRSYLFSSPDRKPKVFHGTVAWVTDDHSRGEVDVEELRYKIRFIPLDFPRGRQLKRHDPLPDFHIAFNFIGPIADPVGFLKSH